MDPCSSYIYFFSDLVDSPKSTNQYFINKIRVQLTMTHQVAREILGNIQIKLYFSHETAANLKNVHVLLKYAYLKILIQQLTIFQ